MSPRPNVSAFSRHTFELKLGSFLMNLVRTTSWQNRSNENRRGHCFRTSIRIWMKPWFDCQACSEDSAVVVVVVLALVDADVMHVIVVVVVCANIILIYYLYALVAAVIIVFSDAIVADNVTLLHIAATVVVDEVHVAVDAVVVLPSSRFQIYSHLINRDRPIECGVPKKIPPINLIGISPTLRLYS